MKCACTIALFRPQKFVHTVPIVAHSLLCPAVFTSEEHLQRELNLSGLRGQRRDVSGASNALPITLKERVSRNRKIGVVEDIKNLGPELDTHRLARFEGLLQRKIDIG